jgi:hypothetical protein
MKTLYLHVGMHKAGSTSIQKALNKDRAALLDQGIYMPLTGTENNTESHQNIAWELNRDDRFVPEHGSLDDLFAELSHEQPQKVILSAEGFTSLDTRPGTGRERQLQHLLDPNSSKVTRYHRMREFAQGLGYRIVTIGFIREYVACLNSAYTQQIKTFKRGHTFAEHVEEQRDNDRWCYARVFAGWEAISGEVICVPNGEDNVQALYEMLGVKRPEQTREARLRNGNVGPKTIECSRILYRALEEQMHQRVGALRHRSKKVSENEAPHRLVKKMAKRLDWNAELFWGFDPLTATQVHEHFVERDRPFLDKHKIRFAPAFEKRLPNDFYLEQASAAERAAFVGSVNEIFANFGIEPLA